MLEVFIFPIGLVASFLISYYLTPKLFDLFIGEILVYKDKDGKCFRVWRRKDEAEESAIARLKLKADKARRAKRDMPYMYWRWWVSMLFMWPVILLVVLILCFYKTLIKVGNMLVKFGEAIENFRWDFASHKLDQLVKWVFQE